jgi:Dolichyl-phosphate-mannose-protein mannosyltransferase
VRWVTESPDIRIAGRSITPKRQLVVVCAVYFILSGVYGSVNLDVDEFGFIREPYEMVGGDYTKGYLIKHEVGNAAVTALKSYYLYWKYRPLFSPIIDEKDKRLFQREETRFGYKRPVSVQRATDPERIAKYAQRLVVPEPDRFYRNGTGKPLLPALLTIPQLGLVQLVSSGDRNLLAIQFTYNYHPMFILVRLAQILSGIFTILLVYWILAREYDQAKAVLGAAVMAFFPVSIKYFPNLHHDAILAPFALLAAYWVTKQQYPKAGIFFGLALASKNAAIFLAPALLGYVIWEALDARKSDPGRSLLPALRRGLRGWATAMLVGLVVLAPFANPISYLSEILTPITHRQYDPRGEDVSARTVAERIRAPVSTAPKYAFRSAPRPAVRLTNLVLGYVDIGFLFIAIAAVLLFSRRNGPQARMCLLVLTLAVPYGLVFGNHLNYRALMFVPFFAILAADVGRKRPLQYLVVVLLLIDLVYCLDPITVDAMHYPVNKDTFPSALLGWMRL